VFGNDNKCLDDVGAQSDSEVSPGKQSLTSDITSDRGYTSDPEVYENRTDSAATSQRSPSSHGSWLMVARCHCNLTCVLNNTFSLLHYQHD
jgi:hypothetical protein